MSQSSSKLGTTLAVTISILLAAGFAYYLYDHFSTMGTRLVIAGNEAVNYSGTATENQARCLGEALKRVGYFDGTNEIDVLLSKGDQGTIISFIVSEQGYTDPIYIEQFKFIAEQIAYSVGGVPITVQLRSTSLSTKKEFKVTASRWGMPVFITEIETVYRLGDTTEDQAWALGKALIDIHFFKGITAGNRAKDVFLRKENGTTTIGIVTATAGWQEEDLKKSFHEIVGSVADAVGGKPVTLQLLDDLLAVQYEHKIE